VLTLNRKIPGAARRWLHLPHDVPKSLFHAHTAEGGLGLPELMVLVPMIRRTRAEKLFNRATWDRDPVLCAVIRISKDIHKERQKWKDGVDCYGTKVTIRATRERATAHVLHTSCDGAVNKRAGTSVSVALGNWKW